MKDDQYVVRKRQRTKKIRIVRVAFGAIEKREKSIDFHQSKASKNRIKAHGEIKKVGR